MNDFYIILNNINSHLINDYFKYFIEDIYYMNKKGRTKTKDYILENLSPNICSKSELNHLSKFASRILEEKSHISKNDICLALLISHYNITVFEYDDCLNHGKLIKYANNFHNVISLYMEIAGITCSIGSTEHNCCYSTNNITYYDFNNSLSSEIRRYMILGNRQVDNFV
jgi:hypothetical protein